MAEFNPGGAGSLNAAVKQRLEANADTNTLTDAQLAKVVDLAAALDVELGSVDWRSGGGGGFTEEQIQDIVGAMLSGDEVDGLTINYDDDGNVVSYTLNDGVVIRQTPWDASSGSFPAGAQNGYRYLVSVGGTVGGQAFLAGDYLQAITDDASTSVYAANWERIPTAPTRYATAAQGGLADTALQPSDLDPTYTALSASRDTVAGDDGADIECTGAATLTVVAGTITRGLTVTQLGAGAATIAAGVGVTINKESDVQAVTNGQYAVAFLKPTGTVDTFILTGSLAAV